MKLDEMFKKTPEVKPAPVPTPVTAGVNSVSKTNEQPIVKPTPSLEDDADLVEASKSYGLGDNVSLEWLASVRKYNPSLYEKIKNWD